MAVIVTFLFLEVSWVCLWYVALSSPGHTQLCFYCTLVYRNESFKVTNIQSIFCSSLSKYFHMSLRVINICYKKFRLLLIYNRNCVDYSKYLHHAIIL